MELEEEQNGSFAYLLLSTIGSSIFLHNKYQNTEYISCQEMQNKHTYMFFPLFPSSDLWFLCLRSKLQLYLHV